MLQQLPSCFNSCRHASTILAGLVTVILELPNQSLQLTQRPTPLLLSKPLKPLAVDALGRRWMCCRGRRWFSWRRRWCGWTLSSSRDLHVHMCVSGRVGAQGACACGRVCWRRCPLLPSHGVCWCLLRDACTLTHRHKDTGAIQVRYNRLARSVHIDKQVGTQRQSGWHS